MNISLKLMDEIFIGSFPSKISSNTVLDLDNTGIHCFITNVEDNLDSLESQRYWPGCLYGSEEVLTQIKKCSNLEEFGVKTYCLRENESITFQTKNRVNYEVTMFNLSDSVTNGYSFLFKVLEVDVVTYLITTSIENFFKEILQNRLLRQAVRNTIDWLYIDDYAFGCKNTDTDLRRANKIQLRSMVKLVRPKKVVGISGASLPLYMKDLCQYQNDDIVDR